MLWSAPCWKVSNVQTYGIIRFRQSNLMIQLLRNDHCDVCSSVFFFCLSHFVMMTMMINVMMLKVRIVILVAMIKVMVIIMIMM